MNESKWLRTAQIAWIIFVVPALVLYIAGWLIQFDTLHRVCTDVAAQCAEFDYVTPVALEQLNTAGISMDAYAWLVAGVSLLYAILPVGLGLLIFIRKRDEFIGLLVSFFLVTFGLAGSPLNVASNAFQQLGWYTMLITVASSMSLPLFFGMFPNGQMVPRVYWLVVVMFGVLRIGGDIFQIDSMTNQVWNVFSFVAWLSVLVGGTAAQIYRYLRVATFEEKRQTRWVLFGLGLLVVWILSLVIYTAVIGDWRIGTNQDPSILRRVIFLTTLQLAFQFIYLSIGMAILRSRLFDIDVIIRRTVTYALVVALLLFVYFGSVILLQQLFASVTGQRSEIITIVSTLAIAALFIPLRNRVQNAIDKRFNRKKYDAAQVLQKFAETVRDETDLDKLNAELLNVVNETMQPKNVSVWLKSNDRKQRTEG